MLLTLEIPLVAFLYILVTLPNAAELTIQLKAAVLWYGSLPSWVLVLCSPPHPGGLHVSGDPEDAGGGRGRLLSAVSGTADVSDGDDGDRIGLRPHGKSSQ